MGNSYFLYKKYFKIGQQDWLPVLPEEYSFSGDSENPMPMVLKKEDDRLCGNIPPMPPVYRWHQLPISEDYECSAGTKYYVDVYQISYDGGNTWEDVVPERTRTGAVYQTGSSDCIEYRWHQLPISEDYICDECPEGQYRWTATTGYVCSGVNKMTREIEEVSYDSGTTWTPTGDERAALPLIEADSPDCGYVPPIEPQYRWVNMDISTDYICDDCPPIDPQYRTLTTATTCISYDKYTLEEYQVSYDSGTTWETTGTSATTLIEADSPDCGYVPPTFQGKWLATYTGGTTSSAECDSISAITNGEISKTGLETVFIGDCVREIAQASFSGCSSLTSVTIPDSVTIIYLYAFRDCVNLPSINIPSGVTTIKSMTFAGCTGLTSVTIGNGVTSIEESAFNGCSSLTDVTIPSGVTNIGQNVFRWCTGLSSVTVLATTPPTLGSGAFNYTNDCPIYVPSESVNTYKSASGWSSYASRIQAIP